MISKVLLDTCFLIELTKKNAECHKHALDYFNYFNEKNIEYYLSPIVLAEYWHNGLADGFPIENFKQLTYTCVDGCQTGNIAKALKEIKNIEAKGTEKNEIKDDYKLLAQLIVNNKIDCFITKDGRLIKKYVEPLKEIIPALKKVLFIDIKNQPIENTLEPQKTLAFPDSQS